MAISGCKPPAKPHFCCMEQALLTNRGVLALGGADRVAFVQGLVSNDVRLATQERTIYACLLTPQGRFLHDMFIYAEPERLLLECEADRRDDLLKRLKMFALRSAITLQDVTADFAVQVAWPDETGLPDPRHLALGSRQLAKPENIDPAACVAYDRHRLSLGVPDGSRDMSVGEALLLENNIDALNGIAWDKGCYMGQELTARTKYRGLVKKQLRVVQIEGEPVPVGTILHADGKEVGEMRTSNGDLGLALIRKDYDSDSIAEGQMILKLAAA